MLAPTGATINAVSRLIGARTAAVAQPPTIAAATKYSIKPPIREPRAGGYQPWQGYDQFIDD